MTSYIGGITNFKTYEHLGLGNALMIPALCCFLSFLAAVRLSNLNRAVLKEHVEGEVVEEPDSISLLNVVNKLKKIERGTWIFNIDGAIMYGMFYTCIAIGSDEAIEMHGYSESEASNLVTTPYLYMAILMPFVG